MHSIRSCAFTGVALFVAGCGADVATTAAIAGKAGATQAQQAKATQERVRKDLDAAMQPRNADPVDGESK